MFISFKVSNLIVLLVGISILSNYIYGISGFGATDDMTIIITFFVGLILSIGKGFKDFKLHHWLIKSFVIYTVLAVIFLFDSPMSFVYEFYKIFVFLAFLQLMSNIDDKILLAADKGLVKLFVVFLSINLFIIMLQYMISPYIITLIGLPEEQIWNSCKTGRWIGFFEGVNTFGFTALLSYIFNDYVNVKNKKLYKSLKYISLVSVFVSTSKMSFILLLVYIVIREFVIHGKVLLFIKKLIPVLLYIGILAFASWMMLGNVYKSKIEQYIYAIPNILYIDKTDRGRVEARALRIAQGIQLVKNDPFGLGLGTWGDNSAAFNKKYKSYGIVTLSDSGLIHLVAEQGVFVVFYYLVLFSGYFSIKNKGDKRLFLAIVLIHTLSSVTNMGFSSGSWPLFFAYFYARLCSSGKTFIFCSNLTEIPVKRLHFKKTLG